jgi:hypothetical protein
MEGWKWTNGILEEWKSKRSGDPDVGGNGISKRSADPAIQECNVYTIF